MFDTSDLEKDVNRLRNNIKQRQDVYKQYVEKEAALCLNMSGTERVTGDMQKIYFKNGILAQLVENQWRHHSIHFYYSGNVIAELDSSGVRFRDGGGDRIRTEAFTAVCTSLTHVVACVDLNFLLSRRSRWQNVISPSLTPETLSSLYCACAVRWVAGQFPSTPWEDVLVGCVIPRIVFGNEISLDQNKTNVV